MHLNPDLINFGLKTIDGFALINYLQIIRCKADGNITLVYLHLQEKPLKVYHTFQDIENRVMKTGLFFKCHRSHIVGIKHIKHFIVKTNTLVTEAGEVPISDAYVAEFKERFCR